MVVVMNIIITIFCIQIIYIKGGFINEDKQEKSK